jgi:uncharacterized protein YrrD
MHFKKGNDVYTASGEKIGSLSRVVIDAKTRDVTDLVVKRGAFPTTEKVIPVGLVDVEDDDRIILRETNQGIEDFMDYETAHYVPVEQSEPLYGDVDLAYWYPPTNLQLPPGRGGLYPDVAPDHVIETESSIPEGRVAISEGAQVISADDKHIGNVEQVIADSGSNNVTHFVVGKGFLLKQYKLVPVQWVNRVKNDKIYLSVEARLFDHLPDYQTK